MNDIDAKIYDDISTSEYSKLRAFSYVEIVKFLEKFIS